MKTPGPWKWFNYPDGRKLLCARDRAVIHCADAAMTVDAEDQAAIAAVPDLLAACRELVACWDGCRDMVGATVAAKLTRADAAIAKADDLTLITTAEGHKT